ncbi:MAG: hypothetical protein U0794_07235 [Isosphaeraceae bacterium]
MSGPLLVIHERIGHWARQLRPRLAGRVARTVETRNGADLETVLRGAGLACPLLVLDLGRRVRAGLDDLQLALSVSPDLLSLVLDPFEHEGVELLAREIGATHVVSGPITPPAVADLLRGWVVVAQRREEAAGWTGEPSLTEPEPWNWLKPLLAPRRP